MPRTKVVHEVVEIYQLTEEIVAYVLRSIEPAFISLRPKWWEFMASRDLGKKDTISEDKRYVTLQGRMATECSLSFGGKQVTNSVLNAEVKVGKTYVKTGLAHADKRYRARSLVIEYKATNSHKHFGLPSEYFRVEFRFDAGGAMNPTPHVWLNSYAVPFDSINKFFAQSGRHDERHTNPSAHE